MPVNGKKFKVRTGCITCKIRKIKCDESKPACTRCTSTGRKCDGYAKPNAESSEHQQSLTLRRSQQVLSHSHTLYADVGALASNTSASEHRWLEYFSQHVGPALSDFGDKDFWMYVLPQLSISESSIRHALLAIGSSYAQSYSHSTINGMKGVERDHSIKHYGVAMANLRRRLLQAPGDATVPLICCLLFVCLQCLYGNQPLMLDHLNNGLKILSSTWSTKTDAATIQPIRQKLDQIFCRLDAQSTLVGKPMVLPTGDPALAFSLQIPSSFDDIMEAKMYLDTIASMSLNFISLASDGTLFEKYPNSSAILIRRRIQEQLMAWRNALDNFEQMISAKNIEHKEMAARLRIEYHASFIYLSNSLELEQTSYDAYKAQFAAIVSLARGVLSSHEEAAPSELTSMSIALSINTPQVHRASFTLEGSLIPSLYLTAIKCRDPVIRRDAISLLEEHNGKEGLWGARINCRLARRIVEIEEQSMLIHQGATTAFMEEAPSMRMQTSNGAVLTDLPYEKFRVLNGDILRTFEEGPQSPAQIAFYTRPNGVSEQEHVWVEELWF